MAGNEITQKEKIQILLAEYSSLRMETVTRGNVIPQISMIGVASLALIFTAIITVHLKLMLFVFLLGVVLLLMRFVHRDVIKAGDRLRQLETKINERAGEPLLEWETRFAAGTKGFWNDIWPSRWRYGP